MVISAENPQRPPDPMETTAAPARSLHNFSSFPILKTWGHRKVLRCLNVNRKGQIIRSHQPPPPAASSSPIFSKEEEEEEEEEEDDGLEKVRAKLLVHLQEAADKMNLVTTPPPVAETEPEPVPLPPPPASSSSPPWNLRKKKAAPAKHPSSPPPPPPPTHEAQPAAATLHVRTVRLRSEAAEKKERPRFSISLSMREIDEDIYSVTGTRARRRPRKRPRVVQKQLDMLFPGSWLTEITAETYKVPE